MLSDKDIRSTLFAHLCDLKAEMFGDPFIVEEMGVGGRVIDMALLGDSFHGYEIKSDRDSLKRLADQNEAYNKVFDRMTIVCTERHYDGATAIVPDWWGVTVVEDNLRLNQVRRALLNPSGDRFALASLLWRPEALALLEKTGHDRGVRSKKAEAMFQRIADRLSWFTIREEVRESMRKRDTWKALR